MATKKNGLTAAQKRELKQILDNYEAVLTVDPTHFDKDLHANEWKVLVKFGASQLGNFMGDNYPLTMEILKKVRKFNAGVCRKPNWLCEVDGINRFGGSRARSIGAIMSDPNITAAQRLAELSARKR